VSKIRLRYENELIRPAENAVGVAMLTVGLNDPFHLDEFERLRQGIVTALVACAPRQVAPSVYRLCKYMYNG
jgi:telomere length regulation protein